MITQLQVPLLNLPIALTLISDGRVGFSKRGSFKTIFDMDNTVVITEDFILVQDETIRYNVAVVMTEKIKSWLVSLQLEKPW